MITAFEYGQDGASPEAKAVLAYLQSWDGIANSWNDEFGCFKAEPEIVRWDDGRQHGYVIYMMAGKLMHSEQINIAFFTHANNDNICAMKWISPITLNPPHIGSVEFLDEDGVSIFEPEIPLFTVPSQNAYIMADWIYSELSKFWAEKMLTPVE